MKVLIAKSGINALKDKNPINFKFHSDFSTLKYFKTVPLRVQFTADSPGGTISGRGRYDHNLGYYPYIEAYVKVGASSPGTNFEYCPFVGAGATVLYSANIIVTKTQITCYGEIDGVSTSEWYFDFLLFIFKNNLGL